MQDARDFRRFLRRVTTNEYGFYRFESVPGNTIYFIFATPDEAESPIRNFEYFKIEKDEREIIKNLEVFRSSIVTDMPESEYSELQLRRLNNSSDKQGRIVWWQKTENLKTIEINNLPTADYVFHGVVNSGEPIPISEVFSTEREKMTKEIQWKSK